MTDHPVISIRAEAIGEATPETARSRVPADARHCDRTVLPDLCGLEAVQAQLADVIAVLEAEQSRRSAGALITRAAWKNLVFTGGPGTGKSRTAAAVARAYQRLGVLPSAHVTEVAALDLVGTGPAETGMLVAEAIKYGTGGIVMITDAHAWHRQPDHGRHVLRRLYEQLTKYRNEMRDNLAVILAGQRDPLRHMLHDNQPLADRFRAIIDFPAYTPGQLATVFTVLVGEAGLTLTTAAARKAAEVLAQAETATESGNARLTVRLLAQATALQGRRLTAMPQRHDPALLTTLTDSDIPDHLPAVSPARDEDYPGQYL